SSTVCGPCTFQLNGQQRKLSIRVDDLITTTGGGFDTAVKLGFAVIVVSGSGAEAVNIQAFVVNSHRGPFDLAVFGFEPQPMSAARQAPGTPETRKTFSFPHVLETSTRALSESNATDTVIYATYTGGLTGVPAGTNASLELYLYDELGQPMIGG